MPALFLRIFPRLRHAAPLSGFRRLNAEHAAVFPEACGHAALPGQGYVPGHPGQPRASEDRAVFSIRAGNDAEPQKSALLSSSKPGDAAAPKVRAVPFTRSRGDAAVPKVRTALFTGAGSDAAVPQVRPAPCAEPGRCRGPKGPHRSLHPEPEMMPRPEGPHRFLHPEPETMPRSRRSAFGSKSSHGQISFGYFLDKSQKKR